MTCIVHAPVTPDDWLAVVSACAVSIGGPDWASTAILGAQAALLLFVVAALVGYVVGRWTHA